MRQTNKGSGATVGEYLGGIPNMFESPWHYVSVGYGGKQMGLLVETGDEEEARREGEELCTSFGADARILSVRRVVVQ